MGEVKIDQVWRERYMPHEKVGYKRFVRVVKLGSEHAYIQNCNEDGVVGHGARINRAQLKRFNGGPGNYVFVKVATQ